MNESGWKAFWSRLDFALSECIIWLSWVWALVVAGDLSCSGIVNSNLAARGD
jgi:hypothetical protein